MRPHFRILSLRHLLTIAFSTCLTLVYRAFTTLRTATLFRLRHRIFFKASKAVLPPEAPEPEFHPAPKAGGKFQGKPARARQKVIRLCAINPHASLRDIQAQFNRSEAARSGETVSHTYVSRVRKAHAYEIGLLARENHNRRPRPVPRHLIWATDLTFLPNERVTAQPLLGILEHASRACLTLTALPSKTSVVLLRTLADVIERLEQKPKILRTDNEAIFTSKAFRFGLWLARIRHQTTDVASPWQNGKIERFSGFSSKRSKGWYSAHGRS